MYTQDLKPLEVTLDFDNPRFSLFELSTEEEVIQHLLEFENLYELVDSYLKEGYNTLGERIIVLEQNHTYIVLEGNRRIAAIKCLFKYNNLLKSSYREKIKALNINEFDVSCDIVKERMEASYKIAAKHISSIKSWRSIDKYVYYHNMFHQLLSKHSVKDALDFIKETTPESLSEIKKDIKYYNFLSEIHSLVKKEFPDLEPLSLLDNDVLTSRVYNALKKELGLREEQWIKLKVPTQKSEEFSKIIFLIGKAAWRGNINEKSGPVLNTRTFQKQDQWNNIVSENRLIPNLDVLIKKWHSSEQILGDNKEPNNAINENNQSPFSTEEVNDPIGSLDVNLTTTNVINNESQPIERTKYRLFINKTWTNNLLIDNTKDTDLINAVLLYDDFNNIIPYKSSEYKKVQFSATNQRGILLKESTVLQNTKPAIYTISVSFKGQQENFTVTVISKIKSKAPYFLETFIDDKWLTEMTTSLEKSYRYEKIITTLNSLSKQSKGNMNSIEKADVLIISFLIRTLLEYISKAYGDIYKEIYKNKTASDNLPNLIKFVAEDMFSKDPSMFTIEKKKAIKSNDDIELLNGIIHDYSTVLSNQDFKRIFAKYIPYIESVIFFLEENK
ncbi:MAG: hypothetical protein ACQEV0_02365 [Bacillota bacterium]